jgi:hypothetical protein
LARARRSDQSREAFASGTRIRNASATSGKRSWTQFTTRFDASAAMTDNSGGSVIATMIASRSRRIAKNALR